MVSYYNPLSTMFPAHHAASQPHSAAAAAVAARHAASYFPSYHHHHYGYPQHHHQFPPSATSPGNSSVPTSTTAPSGTNLSGQYPANLSDLNSNVCGGGVGLPPSLSGPGFGPSHHQHLDAVSSGNGFQPNPAITPPSWHASQSVWHPSSPFWAGSCNVPTGGQSMEGLLQQQNDLLSSNPVSGGPVSVGARSPNTPPRGSSDGPGMRGPPAASPGYPSGSHSSGSPNGTPTPVGAGYSGEFTDYSSYHLHHQQQQQHQHLQQQQQQHQQLSHLRDSHDEDDDEDDCRGDLSPSPLSPPSASSSLRPQPARSPYEWMKKPSYQSQPDKSGRTRTKDKYRVVYSDHQRLELEKEFHYSRYITIRRKAELANSVGLSERQVKIWFQNRRAKERRALKKHEDVIMKEKLESAATFGAAMSYSESIHGSCHSVNAAAAMMGGHGMGGSFPPHSLATSIMSGSPQLSLGGPMKFE